MTFRVLNVAEKNDAAKEISRIMSGGCVSRREGFSRFNKIYEYGYNLMGRQCEMSMTSVSGHLMGVEFASGYKKWQSCQPLSLFNAPVTKEVGENMNDIKRTLEREIRRCNMLVIWTDCDREGENIGFEIIDVCRSIKPRIEIYRARFSEITVNSIARACSNLIAPDQLTSFAVDVRQELDLRIGAAFTRFQTLRLQKRFPEVLSDQLISYGSCQFPTLGFVVQRFKAILNFIAETFFKIKVVHVTEEGQVDFSWQRGRLFHQLACQVLHQTCLENPLATVINQSSKPKSKWRPLPLDTVELEKLASRKLKINAKETMTIAEKLYNQGFISYPRTETNTFPSSIDLNELVQQQTVDENWGQFARNILVDGAQPRHGTKTDNAHPPIHPTKHTGTLQGNMKRLYEFIVRHFLACCSKDAQGVETVVDIAIAGERFTAKGLAIIAKNYLEVYPYDKWSDKTLPVYHIGDTFMPTSIDMVESQTQPPSLLTEADLIALMEKHGIGTDATHAEHIEKIKSRCYVGVQNDGTFVPGELGMGLVEGYDAMGLEISKPDLRAELEADLKRICLGQREKDTVLREQIEKYQEVFVQTCERVNQLDHALAQYFGQPEELTEDPVTSQIINSEPAFSCPLCHSHPMCIRKTQEQKFMMTCMGYPECTSSGFFPSFVLNAQVSERICSRCVPRPVHKIKFQFKRGSIPPTMELDYTGCVRCEERLQQVLDFRIKSRAVASTSNNTRNQRGTGRGNQHSSQPTSRGFPQTSNTRNQRGRGHQHPSQNTSHGFQQTSNTRNQRGTGRGNQHSSQPTSRGFPQTSNQRGRGNQHSSQNTSHGFPQTSNTRNQRGRGNQHSSQNTSRNDSGYSSFMPNEDTENPIVCICRQNATKLTVRKQGPNTGRQFYKCARMENACSFFLWADDEARQPMSSSSATRNDQASSNRPLPLTKKTTFTQQQKKYCSCQQEAVTRTVQKNGPNQHRQFFTCPKPQGQSCSFFEWLDSERPTSAPKPSSQAPRKKRCCSICHQAGHTKNKCPRK